MNGSLTRNTNRGGSPLNQQDSHLTPEDSMKNLIGTLLYALLCLSALAAWITHIVVGIAAKAWLFLIFGALVVPVAVIHGYSVWLGLDWLN